MKILAVLSLVAVLSLSALGQTTQKTEKSPLSVSEDTADSLHSKRNVFFTSIYRGAVRLRTTAVLTLYRGDQLAKQHYRAGLILQPMAPLASVAGIAVGYIGLKGKSDTYSGIYEGKPVTVEYTVRSRSKLAAGLGLFVAGIALIEFSNELVAKSARGYNLRHEGPLSTENARGFTLD